MPDAQTLDAMSPGLLKVGERAQREPEGRFHARAHLIDVPALNRAYPRQHADAAGGGMGAPRHITGRTWRRISRPCTSG